MRMDEGRADGSAVRGMRKRGAKSDSMSSGLHSRKDGAVVY